MRNLCAPKPTISENDIERIFNDIDDDGNGYITLREAKKAFKQISKRFGLEDKVLYYHEIIHKRTYKLIEAVTQANNNLSFLSHKSKNGLKNVILIKTDEYH